MRPLAGLIIACVFLPVALTTLDAWAERATPEEMERVCRNWVEYMVYEKGSWAGSDQPEILEVRELVKDGILLARCYSISPKGCIVVPVLKELPPIKAHSDECDLDAHQDGGMAQLLRDVLHPQIRLFEAIYGNLDASQPATGEVAFDRANLGRWERLSVDPLDFKAGLRRGKAQSCGEVGPLLTTAWDQGDPYNMLCPLGDGDRCIVGCMATAVAQIMNYHEWPLYGTGGLVYDWDGDNTVGSPVGARPLWARFSDPYDWSHMPDSCVYGCNLAQEYAVAELCYEVGVAFQMDYGVLRSGAFFSRTLTILPMYFRYDPSLILENRSSYGNFAWWMMMVQEINAGRPVLYSLIPPGIGDPHAVVVDGWTDNPEHIAPYELGVHINFGWGWIEEGRWIGWYALDAPNPPDPWPPDWPGVNTPVEELIRYIMPKPFTVHQVSAVRAAEFATIQAAISGAQAGDVVEVADDIYTGAGNRDLDFAGKPLTIRSQSGNPDLCVIDCEGIGRGLYCHSGETPGSVLEGMTIRNGSATDGGAVLIGVMPPVEISPTFLDCVFSNNSAQRGGAIYGWATRVTLIGCRFSGNSAGGGSAPSGGAMFCDGYSPKLACCTFSDNSATGSSAVCYGGGIYWSGGTPVLTHSVFSDNSAAGLFGYGGGMYCGISSVTIAFSTFLGNSTSAMVGSSRGGGLYGIGDSLAVLLSCTFSGNSADQGGGIACEQGYALTANNTIIAFGPQGEAAYCDGTGSATFGCSDVHGNDGGTGDWVGCLTGQEGLRGNFCMAPLFCDASADDYHLEVDSPCAPGNHPDGYDCGLIGAHGAGCDWTPVHEEVHAAKPAALVLAPNVPNPFNPVTEISYAVPGSAKPSRVTLKIYNCLGQRVRTLVDRREVPGFHSVTWDGKDDDGIAVASGVYFCRLLCDGESRTRRMILLK